MGNIEYRPSDATLIDPVAERIGSVEIDESANWNGWAYDNADAYSLDPVAIFKDRSMAAAFDAFRRSEHCPEQFRTGMDAAIMPCHVPQIVCANHFDDGEAAMAMSTICRTSTLEWLGVADVKVTK